MHVQFFESVRFRPAAGDVLGDGLGDAGFAQRLRIRDFLRQQRSEAVFEATRRGLADAGDAFHQKTEGGFVFVSVVDRNPAGRKNIVVTVEFADAEAIDDIAVLRPFDHFSFDDFDPIIGHVATPQHGPIHHGIENDRLEDGKSRALDLAAGVAELLFDAALLAKKSFAVGGALVRERAP
ncbi:MAG: hypothetical protein ING19_07075 [Azospirillum sp.]|nr:hypothetical protein [Azospirillum sp.]